MSQLFPYVVRQGDFLEKLAHERSFDAQQAWEAPENAELRQTRDKPTMLCPGDILYLPKQTQRRPCDLELEAENRFTTGVAVTRVRKRFVVDGEPLADMAYYVYGMGEVFEDVTDANGAIDIDVPLHIRRVKVQILAAEAEGEADEGEADEGEADEGEADEGEAADDAAGNDAADDGALAETKDKKSSWTFEVSIGHLDPANTPSGARQRLEQMQFLPAHRNLDEQDDALALAHALEDFQTEHELEVSGELDAATIAKLRERHGA